MSPGQACQKETAILTLSESNIREAKDLRAIMKCQEKEGRVSAPLSIRLCALCLSDVAGSTSMHASTVLNQIQV
uniref:Uncharacterized protein n=3 Tax=Enterobacteriaceae TaxID=543 RepID=W8QFR8_KLEPN|nr:hypothetical protein [Klebsiella pneumoniae]AIT41923.1 hypothetical protein [Klebsiella pneumoniae]